MVFRDFPNVTERQVDEVITLRPAVDADFPILATLLHALASRFITPGMAPEVAATFLRDNDESALRVYGERGHTVTVAEIDGVLAGFIAIRPPSHVFHLFVDARWHRRSVARALWEAARQEAAPGTPFTVNASLFAVPVYQALGFRCDGAALNRHGVTYQPMLVEASGTSKR